MWPSRCGIIELAIRNNSAPTSPSALHVCRPLPSSTEEGLGPHSHGRSIGMTIGKNLTRWWILEDFAPPEDWVSTLASMTGKDSIDSWGLRAAIYVARTRKRYGRGPSFSELFDHLMSADGIGLSQPENLTSSQRRVVRRGFERYAASAWRSNGWVAWSREAHSLRVGPAFRAASRAHQDATRRATRG